MLEELLVAQIGTVEGLAGKVYPLIDITGMKPPIAAYGQVSEDEADDLSHYNGLMSATYELHLLHSDYAPLRKLGDVVRSKVIALQGVSGYGVAVQQVRISVASPEIREKDVGLFRRTYTITIHYQKKGE